MFMIAYWRLSLTETHHGKYEFGQPRYCDYIHAYTNLKLHETEGPLVITEGDGVFVRGEDGKMYLEGAGLWCASLGFSARRLAEAAYRQMLKLPFITRSRIKPPTDIGLELAEKLLSIAPVPMSKVFL